MSILINLFAEIGGKCKMSFLIFKKEERTMTFLRSEILNISVNTSSGEISQKDGANFKLKEMMLKAKES